MGLVHRRCRTQALSEPGADGHPVDGCDARGFGLAHPGGDCQAHGRLRGLVGDPRVVAGLASSSPARARTSDGIAPASTMGTSAPSVHVTGGLVAEHGCRDRLSNRKGGWINSSVDCRKHDTPIVRKRDTPTQRVLDPRRRRVPAVTHPECLEPFDLVDWDKRRSHLDDIPGRYIVVLVPGPQHRGAGYMKDVSSIHERNDIPLSAVGL